MAGYVIYSLDWPKFSALVEQPTPAQFSILARHLADEREGLDGEFDEDDPILNWLPAIGDYYHAHTLSLLPSPGVALAVRLA